MSLQDEAVGLLQQLLRLNTVNPPGNETIAAELLRDYLEPSGIEVELYARTPERANLVARVIGDSVVGTQGTPVEVLGRLIHHVFFPELWRVRNELTALSQEQQKA